MTTIADAEWVVWCPPYERMPVDSVGVATRIAVGTSQQLASHRAVHVLHRERGMWLLVGWARDGVGHGAVA